MTSTLLASAVSELTGFAPDRPTQQELRDRYLAHLRTHGEEALRKSGEPDHLTASCMVFDPAAGTVLLHHHRKAGLWGQFGGHLEDSDPSLAAAALRELTEESGLHPDRWFSPHPVDLDHHQLPAEFGRCRSHLDVVFAATAQAAETTQVSAEGLAVDWFPVDDLPGDLMPDLYRRLPRVLEITRTLVTDSDC